MFFFTLKPKGVHVGIHKDYAHDCTILGLKIVFTDSLIINSATTFNPKDRGFDVIIENSYSTEDVFIGENDNPQAITLCIILITNTNINFFYIYI